MRRCKSWLPRAWRIALCVRGAAAAGLCVGCGAASVRIAHGSAPPHGRGSTPWLLLFGLLAMAALRCGMIAFVEVSSFGIGTSTMYLSTVHPLLLLYTYGCLICYRNKGVITE